MISILGKRASFFLSKTMVLLIPHLINVTQWNGAKSEKSISCDFSNSQNFSFARLKHYVAGVKNGKAEDYFKS